MHFSFFPLSEDKSISTLEYTSTIHWPGSPQNLKKVCSTSQGKHFFPQTRPIDIFFPLAVSIWPLTF